MSTAPLPASAGMRAIAFTSRERAELVDWAFDASAPRGDELVGRTLVSLTSPGTEINYGYAVDRDEPGLTGYATVTEITAVGPDVTDLKPGDRVFHMGNHVSRQRLRREGAWPVPAGLAPETAVFARLMGVSWSTLVTTAARPPARVVVTGLGPVGNLAAQIFRASGYEVTAVDPVAERRALVQNAGVADARPRAPLDDAAVRDRVALVVECSGHEQAVLDGVELVAKGGEVVLIGVPWKRRTEITAQKLLHAIFHRYVHVRSGWEWEVPVQPREFAAGNMVANLAAALRWLAEGRVRVDGLGRLARPSEAQAVYQDLLHQRGTPTVVFDWRGA